MNGTAEEQAEQHNWADTLTDSSEENNCRLTGDPDCASDCDCKDPCQIWNLPKGDETLVEHYEEEGFNRDLSELEKLELRMAEKKGFSSELNELWTYRRDAERFPGTERGKTAKNEAEKLKWVDKEVRGELIATQRRRNNRAECKRVCTKALTENLLYCLCFCGRHREECPTHRVVEPPRWNSIEIPETESDTESDTEPDESMKDDDEEQDASEKKEPTELAEEARKLMFETEIPEDSDEWNSDIERECNKWIQQKLRESSPEIEKPHLHQLINQLWEDTKGQSVPDTDNERRVKQLKRKQAKQDLTLWIDEISNE